MIKKRLLVDARCFTGEGQGMRTYLKGLYNSFHKLYPDYELYFMGYDFEDLKSAFPFLRKRNFVQLKNHSKLKLFFWEFPKIIKTYQIDYAHFQYVTPFLKKCTYIVTTHDVLFLDFKKEFSAWYRLKRKLLFYFSLRQSEIRLTVSNYSKKKLINHFGIRKDTIGVTLNAVSDEFFQAYDKRQIQKDIKKRYGVEDYILYVSRVEKRKNHQLLLETYEELLQVGAEKQLVLIGSNTLGESSLTNIIKTLKAKYPHKVHWFPYLSFQDLISFYKGADLFVYPSKAEGFGIPPIEAGALGINTLCANNTAMSDFNFFGDNLFDAEDKESFKNKLLKNIQTPLHVDELAAITEQIKKNYSWEKSASILHEKISTTIPYKMQSLPNNSRKRKAA